MNCMEPPWYKIIIQDMFIYEANFTLKYSKFEPQSKKQNTSSHSRKS